MKDQNEWTVLSTFSREGRTDEEKKKKKIKRKVADEEKEGRSLVYTGENRSSGPTLRSPSIARPFSTSGNCP